MIILQIYLIGLLLTLIFTAYRELSGKYEQISIPVLLICNLIYPIIFLYVLYDKVFPKRFVHYFDKEDTPYSQEFQPNKKYHKVWKRLKYNTFLGHQAVKIKWFGLITIYKKNQGGN